MASKPRVHELAKELGIASKEVLVKLQEMGEFVKSASSTVEPPVARKLRESYGVTEQKDKVAAKPTGAANSKSDASVENAASPMDSSPVDVPQASVEKKPSPTLSTGSKVPKPAAPKVPRMANNPFSSAKQPVNSKWNESHNVSRVTPRAMPNKRSDKPQNTRVRPGDKAPNRNNSENSIYKTSPRQTTDASGNNSGGNSFPPNSYRGKGGGRGRGTTAGAFGKPGVGGKRNKKSKRQKKQEFEAIQAPSIGGVQLPNGRGTEIKLARGASLTDLAEKIDASPSALVQALFSLGEMVTATQSVSDDTLELLGSEMNFVIKVVSPEDEDKELLESFDLTYGEDIGDDSELVARPPVVTIMGHVDHGKTKLLDAIRDSNVGEKESGGITQHIGAYQVQVNYEGTNRAITFIDTPGHEAFTAMRARGAKSTDIAILIVAADDGVMPQTIEALNHAKAAEVPIVVAVNKIDKEGANPAKIRNQLTEYGLIAEEYGGQTQFIDISAREKINIDKLMEAVLLTADAELDLKANPAMPAQGVTIEANLDKGRGPIATVIIQRGTLHVGDSVVAGDAYGRVRKMVDENGLELSKAGPSQPVQVIGFTTVPTAGDSFIVVEEDRTARQIADRRNALKRNAQSAKSVKKISLEDLESVLRETSVLKLILKGDNSGTVEALETALMNIKVDDEVELQVVDRGVGGITETNVNLAAASDAIIIGFNVRAEGKATEVANREGVEIRYYSVIYKAIEEIEQALKGMLKPIYEEKELGQAEVKALFKSSKVGNIAGCLVTAGSLVRGSKARLLRDNLVVADNITINTLRREKDDVVEVKNGFECGLTLSYADVKVGDTIVAYELVEIARS